MAKSALLKSSLAKKYWMALTGLFLCTFVAGHLAGNLQLFIPISDGARDQFNEYAYFMTHNPVIKVLSYLTYFSILFHAVDGIILWKQNKSARPVEYKRYNGAANARWSSRNMALLGTILLVFIVVHMNMFWAEVKFGDLDSTAYVTESGQKVVDLYTLVIKTFQEGTLGMVWVVAYALSMLALGFHLSHGFASGFQSLGLNHPKYMPIIKKAGYVFAVVVSLGFAIIPFYVRFVLEKM